MMRTILTLSLAAALLAACTASRLQRERDASAHYRLGISHLNNNALQPAIIEFQKGLEASPKDKDLRYSLGHAYFLQGRPEEAEKEFSAAIAIDPLFSEAHNHLGKVLEMGGRLEEATRHYRSALSNRFYATPWIPHFNLGLIAARKGDLQGAIKEYQEALKDEPKFALAQIGLGQARYRLGQVKEAVESYEAAIKLAPDFPDAHYHLGFAAYRAGNRELAADSFRKVLELTKGNGPLAEQAKENLARIATVEKVEPGMSSEQAIRGAGKPEKVNLSLTGGMRREEWKYSNGAAIIFENGKVVGFALRE